jgi:hypothetical protein
MAHIPLDPFAVPRRLALLATLCFGIVALSVSAQPQGFPGGAMDKGAGGMRHDFRREGDHGPAGPALRPHAFALFAAELEKDSASLALKPPAAAALRDLVRELRDFAGLDDRRARERMGLARGTVHAVVDFQRDLGETDDAAHELAASAADVTTRWKALRAQLDDAQLDRIQSIYRAALLDAGAGP